MIRAVSKEQIAYAAGLIDGEGCVTVYNLPGDRGIIAKVQVNLTMSAPLIKLQEWFGGDLCVCDPTHGQKKLQWAWRIQGKIPVTEFLNAIFPYLLIKQEQALLVLLACSTITKKGNFSSGRAVISEEIIQVRKDLVEECK